MTFENLNVNNLLYNINPVNSNDNVVSYPESLSLLSKSSEISSSSIASGEVIGDLLVSNGFIRSFNYVANTSGWTINANGTAQFSDLTLIGGSIKYLKTSFEDTAKGYYIGSEGIYFGDDADAKKFKFTISDGTIDLIGTISGRSTLTIASAINSSGNLITEIVNAKLNTSAKTILDAFTFGVSGAIQIGTYSAGVSGDIRISPNGIVGRNSANENTFTIDTDGNATFAGVLSAASGTLGSITAGTFTGVTLAIGSSNSIFKADSNGIYLGNATFASAPFSVNMSGDCKVSSLARDDFHWFTLFDSIDGFVATPGDGTIICNPSSLDITTGATYQNESTIEKTPLAPTGQWSWNKKRKVKMFINLASDTSQFMMIGMGNAALGNGERVLFSIDGGNLYGYVANGTSGTTSLIQAIGVSVNYCLEIEYNPGVSAVFSVNGFNHTTITTNLPSGNSNSNKLFNAFVRTDTNATRRLSVSYYDFWQES